MPRRLPGPMTSQILDGASYTLTWNALPVLLIGALMAGWGIVVAVGERGSRVSLAFALLTTSIALWLLGFTAIYSTPLEPVALQWARLVQIPVIAIPNAVLVFALAIVRRFREFRGWVWAGVAFSLVTCLGVLLTDRFVSGVYAYVWGYYPRYGPLSFPFLVFFFLAILLSLHLYRAGYRRAPTGSLQERRLKALWLAFAIAYLGSDDYLAAYGVPLYPFGYIAVFVFIVLTARAIRHYRLIDI